MLSLQDEREITTLLYRYATGIDSKEWKLFRSCFHAEITADYGSGVGWSSGDEITAFMRDLHEEYAATLHRITNVVIAGAEAGALVRSYVDALLLKPDNSAMQADGYYDDLVTRAEGGWRIKQRRFTLVRMQGELPSLARTLRGL